MVGLVPSGMFAITNEYHQSRFCCPISPNVQKAVVEATNVIPEVEKLQDSSDINDQISLAEFRVWFGHALMYTGQTERAMILLQQVTTMSREDEIGDYQRRDVIVGRAHNQYLRQRSSEGLKLLRMN